MTDLELALRRLASEVEWPPTPAFALRPRRRRRPALAVLAAALLAGGAALAVPQSRAALLRFLGLGGVRIERVGTLPAAEERPLAAALGTPVTAAEAAATLGRAFVLPRGVHPRLYRSGELLSALLAAPAPTLLTELATPDGEVILKKVVAGATRVTFVRIDGAPGAWIEGPAHEVLAPPLPPRLAGNVLIVVRGGLTYRLEGKRLTLADARRLARALFGQT